MVNTAAHHTNHLTITVDETIKSITSSSNERKALEIIKNRRNEAVLRLIDKGLVYRYAEDMEIYASKFEFELYRYSIIIRGCVRFLKVKNNGKIKNNRKN